MALVADSQPRIAGKMTGEHRFFLTMAIVMAVVIVAGFATSLALGRSSFAAADSAGTPACASACRCWRS